MVSLVRDAEIGFSGDLWGPLLFWAEVQALWAEVLIEALVEMSAEAFLQLGWRFGVTLAEVVSLD